MEIAKGALFVLVVVTGGLALKAGFVGAAVWFELAWPRAASRMLEAYQQRGRRCFLVGLVNSVAFLIIVAVLVNIPALGWLGVLLLAALAGLVVAGYGIGYHDLGLRLEAGGAPAPPSRRILLGGLLAETAFLAPVLGQLLSLGVLFRGLGAVVSVLLAGRGDLESGDT